MNSYKANLIIDFKVKELGYVDEIIKDYTSWEIVQSSQEWCDNVWNVSFVLKKSQEVWLFKT